MLFILRLAEAIAALLVIRILVDLLTSLGFWIVNRRISKYIRHSKSLLIGLGDETIPGLPITFIREVQWKT
jgi:hypothetical protein